MRKIILILSAITILAGKSYSQFEDLRVNSSTRNVLNSGIINFATGQLKNNGTTLDALLAGKQPLDADLTALAALSGTGAFYYRSAANTWTPVTIGSGLDFTTGTLTATAVAGTVDDTAFGSGWNGDTTGGASRNAIYDEIHLFDTDDDGKVNVLDQGAGIAITNSGGVLQTPLTDNHTNWDTAFTDRLKWDGGATGLTAATGRTSLGATTVGSNIFTLTNPSAISFVKIAADNTVSTRTPSQVKTDLSLDNVTNDAQTKAAIVPNTAPSAGQVLIGNAGGTAYAKATISGSGATVSLSDSGVLTISDVASIDPTSISSLTLDTTPTLDDSISFYDDTLDELHRTTLGDLAANLSIDTIYDDSSGFGVQFDTSALTGNHTIFVPDAASTTVQPATAPASQVLVGISASGVVSAAKVTALDLSTAELVKTNSSGLVASAVAGTDYLSTSNLSNTAYASSWNGVTTVSPSKNAVYDWGHTFDTDDDGLVDTLDLSSAGLVKVNSGGTVAVATAGTDYLSTANLSNTAYDDTTWDAVTTVAPSKNAVRDYIHSIDPDGNGQINVLDLGVAGIVKTNSSGVVATATAGTDYVVPGGALGTPSSGTLTNCTGLPITGITSSTSSQLRTLLSDENGTGAALFDSSTSATFITPILGTPTSATLTNATGLPVATGISGLGTGVATALAVANNAAGGYSPIDGTATFTNKTISSSTNTVGDAVTVTHDLTAIPNQTGGWNEYFVTGSDHTTTTLTVGTDIAGLVSGTLTGGAVYEFEVVLRLLNGADTNGMKFAIHGGGTGSAATVFSTYSGNTSATGSAGNGALNTIDSLGAAVVNYSGGEGVIFIKGFFTARTTGTPTMSVQLAKVTANTATCRVGSVLRIKKAHT